jgi:hypothetical protein
MVDRKTAELKANYDQLAMKVARSIYLKAQEMVRDVNESQLREEDRNSIRLHIIRMLTEKTSK